MKVIIANIYWIFIVYQALIYDHHICFHYSKYTRFLTLCLYHIWSRYYYFLFLHLRKLRARGHYNLGPKVFCLLSVASLCQLWVSWSLSAPDLSFGFCSVIVDWTFSALFFFRGVMWSCVSRGSWRDIAGGKGSLSFWLLLLLSPAPAAFSQGFEYEGCPVESGPSCALEWAVP